MAISLLTLSAISILLALAIGANDETFAPIVGAKKLTVNQAVLIGSIIIVGGAITIGYNVAKTVGTEIAESPFSPFQILTILISVSLLLIAGSLKGLPLSTTHAMVGSTITISLIIGESVNPQVIWKILISWVASPLIGFIFGYAVFKALMKIRQSYVKGLDDVDRFENVATTILLVAVVITGFSRGGNDVSNAVAPLISSFAAIAATQSNPLIVRIPLLIGGLFMGVGLILIGRRVLVNLGNDVVNLSPTTASAVQIATALVTFTAANLGIPISGTHVLVAAFIGVGWGSGSKINFSTLKKIGVSAILTPFTAAAVTWGIWWGIKTFLLR